MMSKTSERMRMVLKFDKQEVSAIFKQIWIQSLPQMVQHMNEAVNRAGIACDLHVEQTKQDEFSFRYKSGNKGIVYVPSDDEIGVKLMQYEDVPMRTKYIVQTQQGFLLLIKTGEVDQKLEVLQAQVLSDVRDALDEYEEKIVEAKKEALAIEKETDAKDDAEDAANETIDQVPEEGKAEMAVNTDEEPSTPEEETPEPAESENDKPEG